MSSKEFSERFWINGVNGQVGCALYARLADILTTLPVRVSSRKDDPYSRCYDLCDPEAQIWDDLRPGDTFLFLASYCNYNQCEKHPDIAFSVNVDGTARLLDALLRRGARVIFFSSAAVYGESKSPLAEDSPQLGRNVYARTKKAIEARYRGHPLVRMLRPSTLIAPDDHFVTYLRQCERNGQIAEIYGGIVGNPLGVSTVADIVLEIHARWDACPPVLNLAGPEQAGKEDIAEEYRRCHNPNFQYLALPPPPAFTDGRDLRILLDIRSLQNFYRKKLPMLHEIVLREYSR